VAESGLSRVRVALPALASVIALSLTYVIFVRTAAGQAIDASAFGGGEIIRDWLTLLLPWLRTGIVLVLATIALAAGVIGLRHDRGRELTVALVLVLLSVALARMLRNILGRPYLGDYAYSINTLPSTHAAAAASLVVAIVTIWPRRQRGIRPTLIAAGIVTAAGYASVLSFAHRPSDVVAAILLVGALAALLLPLTQSRYNAKKFAGGLFWPIAVSILLLIVWFLTLLPFFSDIRFTLGPLIEIFAAALWLMVLATRRSAES